MALHYGEHVIGIDYLEIPCSPAISSSVNFSGDITTTVNQPSENVYIIGNNVIFLFNLKYH